MGAWLCLGGFELVLASCWSSTYEGASDVSPFHTCLTYSSHLPVVWLLRVLFCSVFVFDFASAWRVFCLFHRDF